MSITLGQQIKGIAQEQIQAEQEAKLAAERAAQEVIDRKVAWIKKIIDMVIKNTELIANKKKKANFVDGRLNVGNTKDGYSASKARYSTHFLLNGHDTPINEYFRNHKDNLPVDMIMDDFEEWMDKNGIEKIELTYQYGMNDAWNEIWLTPK